MWVYGQLRRAQFEILSSAPSSPVVSQVYFDTTLGLLRIYNGTSFITIGVVSPAAGVALTWFQAADGPRESEENDQKVYVYEAGRSQDLVMFFKVPSNYAAGDQIDLLIGLYSATADGAATIQMDAISTLIRADTDAISSTTLQHTKNATAITVTSTASQFRTTTVVIADSNGQIASTAVAAGSLIKIQLRRGTDTDTADIKMIPNYTEITL